MPLQAGSELVFVNTPLTVLPQPSVMSDAVGVVASARQLTVLDPAPGATKAVVFVIV